MPKFCQFTLPGPEKSALFVNPRHVLGVYRNGEEAMIVSQAAGPAPHHVFYVTETLELVLTRLHKASFVPKPWTVGEDRH